MTYSEFVSIALTAVTVVLAALALIIGFAALWGYREIEGKSIAAASDAASRQVSDYLRSTDGIEVLNSLMRPQIEDAVKVVLSGVDMAAAQGAQGAGETEQLAEAYPMSEEAKNDSDNQDEPSNPA